jgi:hypothetical protein
VKAFFGTLAVSLSVGTAAAVHGTVHTAVVPCDSAISQGRHPSSDRHNARLVLGRVWLPKASNVIDLSPVRAGEDRFAKWGIEVLAGRPVALEVPTAWRRTYSLAFASSSSAVVRHVRDGAAVVEVHACAGVLGRWSRYVGGYELRRGACVPLVVRAGRRSQTIRLSLGRRCAGSG